MRHHESNESGKKIPVILVTGFLGAGKTSFLRQIMPLLDGMDTPPCVILNDHANAEIDSSSLRDVVASVHAISGGCICCDSTAALIAALEKMDKEKHSLVFIESNGTTDPYPLLELLLLGNNIPNKFGPILQLAIVNEVRWQKRLLPWDRKLERAQVATASHILCNRGHLASPAQHQRVLDDLQKINPNAIRTDAETFAAYLTKTLPAESSPSILLPATSPHEHTHVHAAIRVELPTMSEAALLHWLKILPRDLLRIKGFTKIHGRNGGCFFQRTDDEKERPTLAYSDNPNQPPCCAVLIGGAVSQHEALALQCLETAMKLHGTSTI